jgi:hypothetical protein
MNLRRLLLIIYSKFNHNHSDHFFVKNRGKFIFDIIATIPGLVN